MNVKQLIGLITFVVGVWFPYSGTTVTGGAVEKANSSGNDTTEQPDWWKSRLSDTKEDAPLVVGLWPDIVPLDSTFHFDHADSAFLDLRIKDRHGKDVYRVIGSNGSDDTDYGFYFSGDFECCIQPLDSDFIYSTLFTEDTMQSSDWWESRARFFTYQLQGPCGNYPDYGKTRVFRLRKMKITLELSDVAIVASEIVEDTTHLQEDSLVSFTFRIQVEPDSTAAREITIPSKYASPPNFWTGKSTLGDSCSCCTVKLRPHK
jgi:hypothetical protein